MAFQQLVTRFSLIYAAYVLVTSLIAYLLEKLRKYNAFTTGEGVLEGINLTDKVAIITGASAGLGKETARVMVKKGCTVYMACRNIKKTEKVKNDLIKLLLKDGVKDPEKKLIILKLDLASLQSCYDFAKKVSDELITVNYLINNAGVMGNTKYTETTDGFEWQFGINHIGHFYITHLLIPLLIRNKTRIINLSSWGHNFCKYNETKNLWKYCYDNKCYMGKMKNTYKPFYNYGITKASNIIFTRYLNKEYRKKGIYSCAIHPGGIYTELARDVNPVDMLPLISIFLLKPWRFIQDIKSIETGVSCTLNAVRMSNDQISKSLYCYYENCNPVEPGFESIARYADDDVTTKLIDLTKVLIQSKNFDLSLN